jgi:hypothetical protein
MLKSWHKFARAVYKANRTTRTVQAWSSGNPSRIAKLYERRMLYRLFAKFTNRLFR